MIYQTYTTGIEGDLIEYGFTFKENDETEISLFDLPCGLVHISVGDVEAAMQEGWKKREPDARAIAAAGEIADFLVELSQCYSRDGDFNYFSAPLSTVQIRERAIELAKQLGVQFPDEEEGDNE